MCNLYSSVKGPAAIRALFRATRDTTGNLPSHPAIFPDAMAPVVFNAPDGERELTLMRWGLSFACPLAGIVRSSPPGV